MNIYCDESGYTGVNLLSEDQPYFVYSAVNLNQEIIEDIIEIISNSYNLQSGEIKGNRIVKSSKGRESIKRVFLKYSKNVRLVFHDKKFALAGKIVETGIEPYLKSNSYFYQTGLNRFIASGLYVLFMSKQASAEVLINQFEKFAKGQITVEDISIGINDSNEPLIDWLFMLISTNLEIFKNELSSDEGKNKFIFDLTTTSLFGLLSEWGKNNALMNVLCDSSKVFINNPVFEMLKNIGKRGERVEILGGHVGYKLIENIEYKDSKEEIGLQIADLFSSTVFYCLKNQKHEFSQEILKIVLNDCLCSPQSFCLMPETDIEELINNANSHFQFMDYILKDALNNPKSLV
jgi:hypothetical protein